MTDCKHMEQIAVRFPGGIFRRVCEACRVVLATGELYRKPWPAWVRS